MLIKIPEAVGWEEIRNSTAFVVVNVSRGVFFQFSGIEAQIWELILGERTQTQIVEELADDYQISHEVVTKDLEDFIQHLHSCGLIETHAQS